MAKKDFSAGLKKMASKPVPQEVEEPKVEVKKSVGRPKEHEQKMLKTTLTLPAEKMGKLRILAVNEGRQLREILEEGLDKVIEEYEASHGRIRIPKIYQE